MSAAVFFEELGVRIERAFRAVDYDETRFPDIAHEALERTPAYLSVRPVELLHDVASGGKLPAQLTDKSTFGEPPLTLFATARFVVDVYFWFDATTSTHEHGFCGAFQVLGGSSLHAIRRFECTRRVNSRFLLGQVYTERCEVLEVGDTRRILPGREFAHALFHLEAPSTTVVVRTRSNPDAAPQYEYLAPHVAFDPFYKPRARDLQLEALESLARVDTECYLDAVDRALTNATLEDTFFLLDSHARWCMEELGSLRGPEFESRRGVCESRHGKADVDKLLRSIDEICRGRDLALSRKGTTDVGERFVLAALLNAHDRGQVLEFLRSRYPDQPAVDTFMRGFVGMAKRTEDGSENTLGVELGENAMAAIRLLLEGVPRNELARRLVHRSADVTAAQEAAVERFLQDLLLVPALSVLAR
ncbi:hypothetical protein AKJ09_10448 [Labilithrix luteola]|uniref:Uncharacterized protein n=1 Tax=Labilithrix luteola TaxID=1391654 RepID=A0A0K1QEE4_9BACT|nr:hypothetical protein [Labilithrix luteola]AKV03785.1 hypothetical protein AKJ09_10448 [Labilithrix luteola]